MKEIYNYVARYNKDRGVNRLFPVTFSFLLYLFFCMFGRNRLETSENVHCLQHGRKGEIVPTSYSTYVVESRRYTFFLSRRMRVRSWLTLTQQQ